MGPARLWEGLAARRWRGVLTLAGLRGGDVGTVGIGVCAGEGMGA